MRLFTLRIFGIMSFFSVLSCSNEQPERAKNTPTEVEPIKKQSSNTQKIDPKPSPEILPEQTLPPDSDPPIKLPTQGGSPTAAGKAYFTQTLVPLFEKTEQCYSCHAPPRTMPTTPAPLSIFSYTQMRAQLARGEGSNNNFLYRKTRNRIAHGGQDRCEAKGDLASPCKELLLWWGMEFPNVTDLKNAGELISISDTGMVSGYAGDSTKPAEKVSVKFYLDGPSGSGQLVLSLTANQAGYGTDNQAFSGQIPLANIDNKAHKIYPYAVIEGKERALTSGTEYTAYKPNLTQGKPAFDANVSAGINNGCGPCHGPRGYEAAWSQILSPPKHKGGTASNNFLIQKLSGQLQHSGGVICNGGANAGVCASIQQWYNLEFP